MIFNRKNRRTQMIKKCKIPILTTMVIFMACSDQSEKNLVVEEEQVKSINVTTQRIEQRSFASYVRVVGAIETSNDIIISAEVSGKILSYSAKEGELITAGETILKIDDAKLLQEKARLEAQTAQARENFERLKAIYIEDGIGSEIDYLNAKYAYDQSISSLESINIDLENTSVRAPFTGRMESKLLDVGEMVAPGAAIIRLIGTEEFKIAAGVPARYANVVHTGDEVDVWFDAEETDTLLSTITFVANSINPQNRTFDIEVDFPENSENYKVEMISNIRLRTNQQENVLVISEEFVYSKEDNYVVYVLAENDKGEQVAEERVVELGNAYKTEVIIKDGLMVGDQLITLGSAFLDDGMRIKVMNTQNASVAAK